MGWWTGRTLREQVLIGSMGCLALAFGLYQFAYLPLTDYRETSARRLSAASALYHEVAHGAEQVAAVRQAKEDRPAARREATMRQTVTVSAHTAKIKITRLEPQGAGLAVWINAVPAPELHRWIAALSRDFGITVQKASIRRADDGAAGAKGEESVPEAPVRAQLVFAEGTPP